MICNQLDFLNGVFASLQSMSRPDQKTLRFGMETRTFARKLPHGGSFNANSILFLSLHWIRFPPAIK